MKKDSMQVVGNVGSYVSDGNVITFQFGERLAEGFSFGLSPIGMPVVPEQSWLGIKDYQVLQRGRDNLLIDEITREIKENRLLPRLYSKQIKMLYGHGPKLYRATFKDNKLRRTWETVPEVSAWLQSWEDYGVPSVKEFCLQNIKNFYYFGDFFVKWTFTKGRNLGYLPVKWLEALENRDCRLCTTRRDVATALIGYSDLDYVAVGRWYLGTESYQIYPRMTMRKEDNRPQAAISHHREKSVGEFYGVNETHQGARPYIQGGNRTAHFINSFLENSLAAKVHIIIPDAWISSKRTQIMRLCDENKKRKANHLDLIKYNGLEIGTDYSETVLIEYLRLELRKVSEYLTGKDNQGKAYSSVSFMDSNGHEQHWRIESLDLKYKEYIDALIAYDKRTEMALLSSVGLDAAISAVDKDGIISKSGSDTYYNYLIYIMSLTSEDSICSAPLNWALRLNFPELYKDGFRFGFYREVPQRQEDISPEDRLNQQQS